MPEGPEARRTADDLSAVLLHQTIIDFYASARRWQAPEWRARVVGQRVTAVDTHGKNILIHLANDTVLYNHMMMWGRWRVLEADDPPPDDRRVRAWLRTARGLAVLYNGPVFEIMSRDEVAQHQRLTSLGPDALAEPFDRAEFLARLASPDVAELELGEALLDQRIVAGVGNYLKSEILHTAGLDPFRLVGGLSDEERDRLTRHIVKLVRRAYTTSGSTVAPGLTRAWARGTANWYDLHHYVYRRSKRPCRRCGATVQSRKQGERGRLTFWCPVCQC